MENLLHKTSFIPISRGCEKEFELFDYALIDCLGKNFKKN